MFASRLFVPSQDPPAKKEPRAKAKAAAKALYLRPEKPLVAVRNFLDWKCHGGSHERIFDIIFINDKLTLVLWFWWEQILGQI